MVKKGSKHKTTAFGTDAERYLASLYGLAPNPFHSTRPDLVHPKGLFSVEVKSGLAQGILTRPQLRYHLTDEERATSFFGRRGEEIYRALEEERSPQEGNTLFYAVVHRTDGMEARELRGDFSANNLTWGDQFIVPSNIVHYFFASKLATLRRTNLRGAFGEIRRKLEKEILENRPQEREPGSWVGLRFAEAEGIVHRDFSRFTNPKQVKSLDRFRKAIEQDGYEDLYTKEVEGPNETTTHILYHPSDAQKVAHITRSITKRKRTLEELAEERAEAMGKLNGRRLVCKSGSSYNGGLDEERRKQLISQSVGAELIDILERLSYWMNEADWEESLRQVPF